jgi:predicted PurR-regulated permease PerM
MALPQRAQIELIASIATIALLLMLAYEVIAPFVVALAWAGILVFVTWRPFERLARLVRSRWLAAALVVVVIGSVLLVPLVFAGIELSSRIDAIGTWYQEKMATGWPPVPQWIATLPWAGPKIEQFWTGLGTGDPAAVTKARELGGLLIALLFKVAAALGQGFLLVLVSLVFALFFYVGGEQVASWLYALAERIGGAQGVEMLNVAGETVRAVVYGIGGTALVQGTLAFIGYWISGVPYALSFGLVSAVLALIPDGQGLIGFPLAIWLYQQGQTGWAIFLAVWMFVVVGMVDNVIKPLLIGAHSSLPIVLILIGVIGGALAWGALGMFLGPTLLAVCHNVLGHWAFPQGDVSGEPREEQRGAS